MHIDARNLTVWPLSIEHYNIMISVRKLRFTSIVPSRGGRGGNGRGSEYPVVLIVKMLRIKVGTYISVKNLPFVFALKKKLKCSSAEASFYRI